MDNKKKIYIAIIVVCFLITGGVLYFGSSGGGSPAPDNIQPINQSIDNTGGGAGAATGTARGGTSNLPTTETKIKYSAPRVFPSDTALDLTVYSSSQYQNLQDYTPLTVTPEEMGRPNPFDDY